MSETRKPVYREDSMSAPSAVRAPSARAASTPTVGTTASDKYTRDRKHIADAARVVLVEDAELLALLAK